VREEEVGRGGPFFRCGMILKLGLSLSENGYDYQPSSMQYTPYKPNPYALI